MAAGRIETARAGGDRQDFAVNWRRKHAWLRRMPASCKAPKTVSVRETPLSVGPLSPSARQVFDYACAGARLCGGGSASLFTGRLAMRESGSLHRANRSTPAL